MSAGPARSCCTWGGRRCCCSGGAWKEMRMRWAVAWGVLAGLGAGTAWAQEPAGEAGEPGYCAFVRGVGEAESALLLAPDVFASVGVVNAGEAGGGTTDVPLGNPTPRLTAGLSYDAVGLYRGLAVR